MDDRRTHPVECSTPFVLVQRWRRTRLPVHRIRLVPALNSGRRDRFQQLSGGLTHVFTYGPEPKARIPSGMQIGATYPDYRYAVSASIVFEGDVQRLMDVSDPVAEKLQQCELLRLAGIVGRQDVEVLPDRRHDASRCTWATLGVQPIRISRQIEKVLACSLPWIIRPDAGVIKGTEPVIDPDQLLDLGTCVGLDEAEITNRCLGPGNLIRS